MAQERETASTGSSSSAAVGALRDSVFNYQDYTVWRFIHYYQQVHHVLRWRPRSVLEVGPGDHTVTDFLRRKGIAVKTLDSDPSLCPDYLHDIRLPLRVDERFDLILASEVFEHMRFERLGTVLENLKTVIVPGGLMIVSLPYSTIRLFPERPDYGRIVSCEGRLMTRVPYSSIQPLLTLLRGLKRLLRGRPLDDVFEPYAIPRFPDDKVDVHHWDLGFRPTTRRVVRAILRRYFEIVDERAYVNTNCVFFDLRNTPS